MDYIREEEPPPQSRYQTLPPPQPLEPPKPKRKYTRKPKVNPELEDDETRRKRDILASVACLENAEEYVGEKIKPIEFRNMNNDGLEALFYLYQQKAGQELAVDGMKAKLLFYRAQKLLGETNEEALARNDQIIEQNEADLSRLRASPEMERLRRLEAENQSLADQATNFGHNLGEEIERLSKEQKEAPTMEERQRLSKQIADLARQQEQFLGDIRDTIHDLTIQGGDLARKSKTLRDNKKLDFAVSPGVWLLPSNLEINLTSKVGYNNFLQKATKNMQLGVNKVNELSPPEVKTKRPKPVSETVAVSKTPSSRIKTASKPTSKTSEVHQDSLATVAVVAAGATTATFSSRRNHDGRAPK